MQYTDNYASPLGRILLVCDDVGLMGLWFEGQEHYAEGLDEIHKRVNRSVFESAKRWLDVYFSGREPDFMPPIHMMGSDFRKEVWNILLKIPYGKVRTYGSIAKELAKEKGGKVSAQAVGGAVGHNKISIIIPCHRVIGSNGDLTGYAGGIGRKEKLLEIEGYEYGRLRVGDSL